MSTEAASRPTALTPVHERLGASFTDFGGWWIPLRYGSDMAEHRAVREAAGQFDLSHMGEVRILGADAGAFLDYALLGKYSVMKVGKAKYGVIVDESGGILDDLITYRMGEEEFLVLACDGIWDCLSNQQVVDFVRRSIANGKECTEICEAVMDKCLAPDSEIGGVGCDNVSPSALFCSLLKLKIDSDDLLRCRTAGREDKEGVVRLGQGAGRE